MTEVHRSVWIKSLHACSQINQSMQDFTGTTYQTSEPHVEASHARVKRDKEDTDKIVTFFTTINLFVDSDKSLRTIVSGVVAHESVNADQTVKVGANILESMQNKPITDHFFKRKEQAITLGSLTMLDSTTNKETNNVQIDPQILFQRHMLIAANENLNTEYMFSYEICTYPTALYRQHRSSQISEQGCVGRLFVESY